MPLARVTSKGQVTIPVEIRRTMGIKEGDGLLFESPLEDRVRLRVIRRCRLSELAGALPATRRYPGKAAVRAEVGSVRGEELLDEQDS
jgi:AbrB family looped-hinge helix DNA binding protein